MRVLHFDGHHLSRDILLKIMNLAVEIAGPSSAGVSEVCATFQKAGRMRQLVDALAAASVEILRADEVSAKKVKGKAKKSRKSGPGGENLDIWNVKIPDI